MQDILLPVFSLSFCCCTEKGALQLTIDKRNSSCTFPISFIDFASEKGNERHCCPRGSDPFQIPTSIIGNVKQANVLHFVRSTSQREPRGKILLLAVLGNLLAFFNI